MGNVIETVGSTGSITELPTLVEKKSKQTDLNNTPEPMLFSINDLSYILAAWFQLVHGPFRQNNMHRTLNICSD